MMYYNLERCIFVCRSIQCLVLNILYGNNTFSINSYIPILVRKFHFHKRYFNPINNIGSILIFENLILFFNLNSKLLLNRVNQRTIA